MEKDILTRCVAKIIDRTLAESIANVWGEIDHYPDSQCLELNRNLERNYLLNHIESVRHNLDFITKGISAMECKYRPSLLDIGTSPLTFIYNRYLQGVDLFTIDFTSLLAERCKKNGIDHRECDLLNGKLPFDSDSMDMIIFTEVFEHLNCGPGRIFSEIRRLLRPGGFFVFSVPNTARLTNRIFAILGKPVLDPVYKVFKEEASLHSFGDGKWVHGFGHLREYTMSETIDIVRHYGFEMLAARSIDSFIVPRESLSKFRGLLMPIYRFATNIIPNSKMINLVLARKREIKPLQ